MTQHSPAAVGLLLSGGLDSAILLGELLRQGRTVWPLYVQSGLHWQAAELAALKKYLAALASPELRELAVLEQPLADVYGRHWSVEGQGVPDEATPDEAVYLPGRNLLLTIKPAIYCQLQGVSALALGVLGSNPFPDAGEAFFGLLEQTLSQALGTPFEILRPFERLHKAAVMQLGANLPLELTFSCIDPRGQLHCGRCNKCAERKAAFADAGLNDRTVYANASLQPPSNGQAPQPGRSLPPQLR
jgi:7-cyano-7-deazaguanine synthase